MQEFCHLHCPPNLNPQINPTPKALWLINIAAQSVFIMNVNKCEDLERAAKQHKAIAVTTQVTRIISMAHQPPFN